MVQGTSVWLDVYARSVAAAAIDAQTGEVRRRKMTVDRSEILAWIRSLAGPVRVVYEAGPMGFGLARFLLGAGVECVVAAPSKLQRPAGDRVKTDLLTELVSPIPGCSHCRGDGAATVPACDHRGRFAA
jgi:transposase